MKNLAITFLFLNFALQYSILVCRYLHMIGLAQNATHRQTKSGLTGFDSGMKWYVSTRSVGGWLHNPSYRQFNWRKKLRSRCLTEAQ